MPNGSERIPESERKRVPAMPAYWLFMPGIAAALFFLFNASPRRANVYRIEVGVALLILLLGFGGASFRALGNRVSASVCAFVVLCSYWALSFFLLLAFAKATPAAIVYFWFWTLPPLLVAVAASISFARRVSYQWAVSSVVVGFVCSTIALGITIGSKS